MDGTRVVRRAGTAQGDVSKQRRRACHFASHSSVPAYMLH